MNRTREGLVVVREIVIDARPDVVWAFLTDPTKAVRWMGVSANLDPRPGGQYAVEVIPGNVARGEFVEVDPPTRLVITWGWDPGNSDGVPPGSTVVAFDLTPDKRGTLLRVTHRRLPSATAATSHADGWDHYVGRLAIAATGVDPGVDPWIEGRGR